ncbi:MAG: imidazole glycerol phosphate synthase subunit HisH [Rikenellaceae bacterium]|jgi:glutamine amidotransferase|nr:imidazole glycerol phosphate synthase subunit HisH [Rikenellaceae bacterium]
MITIIDYDTGNLRSVANAFRRLGVEYRLSGDPREIAAADRVLLPGVGEARNAMEKLRERGLGDVIRSLTVPTLGICLGMQLLCKHSEEADTACLGIFSHEVRKIKQASGLKIPHMGWNTFARLQSPLFKGIAEESCVYFVHSYAVDLGKNTLAVTPYGTDFSSALGAKNFFGVQFHPEKSGMTGETILKNFLEL